MGVRSPRTDSLQSVVDFLFDPDSGNAVAVTYIIDHAFELHVSAVQILAAESDPAAPGIAKVELDLFADLSPSHAVSPARHESSIELLIELSK
jgi:hypothetical protein